MRNFLRRLLPATLFAKVMSAYHFLLAVSGSWRYSRPSKKLIVIGVTGTKGKSSTTEMVNAIFEVAGFKTAVLNSIRIKIHERTEPNQMRMSMPGMHYIQHFMREALQAECTVAILEMTSEGARQHRHRGIEMDALIFTNLAPEHIESHGSFEAYSDAKYELGKQLVRSSKRPRIMVANGDDPESARYFTLPVEKTLAFTLANHTPHASDEHGGFFTFDDVEVQTSLPGEFNLKNALAAAMLAQAFDISTEDIVSGIAHLDRIPGRAERITAGQDFTVVVDYAHTPDSLTALYDAYADVKKICVLGSTGGGRDTWKRPVMGGIADSRCDEVILTNEDPYDEDPRGIVQDLVAGMSRTPEIIMDRRQAIARAISIAKNGDAVLITGKGTDPCICMENGRKIPWSDAQVTREELEKLLKKRRV